MRLLPYFSCSRFVPGLSWFLYACYPGPLLGSSPGFLGAGKVFALGGGHGVTALPCYRFAFLPTHCSHYVDRKRDMPQFSLTNFSCKSSFWPVFISHRGRKVFFWLSAYCVRGFHHARHRVTPVNSGHGIALRYHLRRTSSAAKRGFPLTACAALILIIF